MSLSTAARLSCVLLTSAAVSLWTVGTATADDAEAPSTPDEGAEVMWPPADTDGEWLPLPDFLYESWEVEACGSVVTIAAGDVREVEYQAMEQEDGTIRMEFRGTSTLDLLRQSDGAMLDELDTSGAGYQIVSADILETTYSFDGPSLIAAFDEVEAAEFASHGLPPLFYYTSGTITEIVVFDPDPEAETVESAEIVTDTALGVYDVCDLLDAAVDH